MFSLGVDIGGSHIAACVFDHTSKKLCEQTFTHKQVDPHGTKEDILESWVFALRTSIALLGKKIMGIGFAMPGPFDYYNGVSKIKGVEKLQSLYDLNLRLELSEALKIMPSQIRFINDASAFLIAEASIGEASAYRRIVAVTLGTGLGASFAVDGKPIIRDKRVPDGGFLYNQYYQNVLADELFSARGILNAYTKRTGKRMESVKAMCDKIEMDEDARIVLEDFGTRLGDFIQPYLSEFGAEALVLGGNISKAYCYFGDSLKKEIPALDKIYLSELGEEAAIIGSALLLNERYYKDIEETLKLM